MATTGHSAYCFETLAAELEAWEPLSYRQVQDLWEEYHLQIEAEQQDGEAEDGEAPEPDVSVSQTLDGDREMEDASGGQDRSAANHNVTTESKHPTLQLPSISRLQAPSPASTSSSSSISTPASSAVSKSSSATSFFSFSRSKQPSPNNGGEEHHPLFITWNTVSRRSGHKSLRGCIGTFDAQELADGLKSYALTAAFDDTRFPPISRSELSSLSCSTTLLTNFTLCDHPLDWDLGTHGIRIVFTSSGKRYNATYLPDVAVEQGWNKEETLASLMRKSGWRPKGRESGWRDVKGGVDVVRYEGKKASLGWAEWKEWREWVREIGIS